MQKQNARKVRNVNGVTGSALLAPAPRR